jgi:hypothetical protein
VQLNDGTGTTRDISTSGIFVVAEPCPVFRADRNWIESFDPVNNAVGQESRRDANALG